MLANCAAYQDGKKLADIQPDEIAHYVERPECFVWVALVNPGPGELAAMQHEFGLHELAVEDARHGHQRPKIEEYGDSIFTVAHTVESGEDALHIGEVDIFVGPNYVLTVRNRTRLGFSAVRARCEREPELLQQGAGFVLYAIIDAIVDRYFPVEHAHALYRAAIDGGSAQSEEWIIDGFGHAESAIDRQTIEDIGRWAAKRCEGDPRTILGDCQ